MENANRAGKIILWCGRNCKECKVLRLQQKENCVLKKDNALTLSRKRKEGKLAEQALLDHLNDLSLVHHEVYEQTKLFPPTTWVWENGAYLNRGLDEMKRSEDELDFLEELKEERKDFFANHFVDVVPRQRRDAGGPQGRPKKILLGHIVVVRNDSSEDLPWYVGEVVKESEEGSLTLTIQEYGSACQKKQTDQIQVR
jgi:hypothetical protein